MASPKDTQATLLAAATGRMEVATVGTVLSYDASTCRAVVQPLIHARFLKPDGSTESAARPAIADVPVAWPGSGAFSLVGELAPGDQVWLAMSGRSLEEWKAGAIPDGGIAPQDQRRHSPQDCVAFPIFRTPPADASAEGATTLRGTELRLGDASATSGVAKGDAVDANLTALSALLASLAGAADWTAAVVILNAFLATPWPATTESDRVKTK